MPWPAKSPDPHPIGYVWGILARAVYADQRQFTSVQDLKETILQCWNDISEDAPSVFSTLCSTFASLLLRRKVDVLVTRPKTPYTYKISFWSYINFAGKMVLRIFY